MGKSKKNEAFDPHNLSAQDQLKPETAQELGLDARVMEDGWKSPTAKESGKIGGLIIKRKRELKKETLQQGRFSDILFYIFNQE